MTITRAELTSLLAKKKGYHKYAIKSAIDDVFDEITELLGAGEKVAIRGFGTFEVKTRKSHPAVHPVTKEHIIVPSYKSVTFRPGDELIRTVKGK